jgi:hypothetical protein
MDRKALAITTLAEADREDHVYWHGRPPRERLAALELMRQVMFGYETTSARLPRLLEVVKPKAG